MASLVCFPFKEEDVTVTVRSVEIACSHPSVGAVLGVGFSKGETWHAIESAAPAIERKTGKKVFLMVQRRIGCNLRGGKGDGMNTALQFFLESTSFSRLHFYDADIISFSTDWISKAEKQADLDFDVVRHYFPRSSTDAMITWFVTKIGFAQLWPNSVLPHIEQPLGGELLITRRAAEVLVADQRVRTQSDWGIDTLYTFAMVQAGMRMAEVYVPEGKVHALYGGLRDLRTMLIECFAAIQVCPCALSAASPQPPPASAFPLEKPHAHPRLPHSPWKGCVPTSGVCILVRKPAPSTPQASVVVLGRTSPSPTGLGMRRG